MRLAEGSIWNLMADSYPIFLGELLNDKDAEKSNRVMQAMLKMTKIDIAELKHAYQQG